MENNKAYSSFSPLRLEKKGTQDTHLSTIIKAKFTIHSLSLMFVTTIKFSFFWSKSCKRLKRKRPNNQRRLLKSKPL